MLKARPAKEIIVKVRNEIGVLAQLARTIADKGIDLHHLYASASGEGRTCLIVFASANNDRAIVLLNE